ncbi:MAG: MBOAT family protein [Deltaproteobacteria bacterium]|nr:MAG: MBOAT family protein [Deltaproteobacteria bacterium]
MLFPTFQFALFFTVLLLFYRAAPRPLRNSLLLGASLVFYFLWIPLYLLLLLAELVVNYALLRAMVRSRHPRLYLVASVAASLGTLGYFKYAGMLLSTVAPLGERLFDATLPASDVLLPLGISFFTFQMIGLVVDTYRKQIPPVRSFREYALFIAFFPQLIAGPILRGRQLLPQLERGGAPSPERDRRAMWLVVSGLAKKVVLADFLLAPFVDRVFGPDYAGSPASHLVGVYSFAFQIYFDFSGYTDMARGLALFLGFELPQNFREPYLSRSPREFWRRWHITLSLWLRDYLYIPLGGNRRGRPRSHLNLFVTMLLGGLWHGAAWTFVVWGGLHGAWLALQRRFGRRRAAEDRPLAWSDVPAILLTFHVVCLLWIFFRAPGFDAALGYLARLASPDYASGWPLVQLGVVAGCAALHVAERFARTHAVEIRRSLDAPWGGAVEGALLGAVAALAIVTGGAGGEFIYFQF